MFFSSPTFSFEPKLDRFERQLQHTEALKQATRLQLVQHRLLEKMRWYERVVKLMQAFRQEEKPDDPRDFERLCNRYDVKLNELHTVFLEDCEKNFKVVLKERVTNYIVGDKAIPITDPTIRLSMLTHHIDALTHWINRTRSSIAFNRKNLVKSAKIDQLIAARDWFLKAHEDAFQLYWRYQELLQKIDLLNLEEDRELIRIADKLIKELDTQIKATPVHKKPIDLDIKKLEHNAGALLNLEVKERSFDQYKELYTDFMMLFNQNDEYSKEYGENEFLQRAVAIIERYTQYEKLRHENWLRWVWSSIKDKEDIKRMRYGEIELILASFDLGMSDKVGQEQINNLLERLAIQALRGGITGPQTNKHGKSSLHDELNKLLVDIRRSNDVSQFRQVHDLQQKEIENMKKQLAEHKKEQAEQSKKQSEELNQKLAEQAEELA
ncbi:MAG: hypothetical protein K0S11_238, partial [Gammaproteobacteria bacterium]|nr:hypothetical protein [Gammaproteobacteria bacterium]